jgi:hypothetical protein
MTQKMRKYSTHRIGLKWSVSVGQINIIII